MRRRVMEFTGRHRHCTRKKRRAYMRLEDFVIKDPQAFLAFKSQQKKAQVQIEGIRVRRGLTSGFFLRGPVPWLWIVTAGRLPGKAFPVAVALWFLDGLPRKTPLARVEQKWLRELGIGRNAAYRAYQHLAAAGLVQFVQVAGRVLRFKIIRPETPPDEGSQAA